MSSTYTYKVYDANVKYDRTQMWKNQSLIPKVKQYTKYMMYMNISDDWSGTNQRYNSKS